MSKRIPAIMRCILVPLCLVAPALSGCATTTAAGGASKHHLGDIWFPAEAFSIERVDPVLLDELAEALREDGAAQAYLTGHAYESRQSAANMSKSKRRADAAAAYLASLGVEADRITTTSRGDADPRIPISNFGERKRNNRVGVYFITSK